MHPRRARRNRSTRRWSGRLALAILGACASAPVPMAPALDEGELTARPHVTERAYLLSWRGARIGEARERETRGPDGVVLERRERLIVRRGAHVVATEVAIAIRADRGLVASSVTWTARTDGVTRTARAIRDAHGWRIEQDGQTRRAPGEAVPAELVPLWVRRDRGFAGAVLLTGRGFAIARGRVAPVAPDRWRADLALDGGALGADIVTDRDGAPAAIVGGDGVVARRASEAELAAPFDPPDAIDAGAIAVRGPIAARGPIAIAVHGMNRTPPPAIPGQAIAADGDTWRVELDRDDRDTVDDRAAVDAIRALADQVAADIQPDLATTARSLADARVATAGDCTTHALAFAARSAAQGLDTRVVTGFRLDGDRLIRHRWALAWTGARWIAVDPSYPSSTPARLFGLHLGAPTDDLDLADLAFDGVGGEAIALPPTTAAP